MGQAAPDQPPMPEQIKRPIVFARWRSPGNGLGGGSYPLGRAPDGGPQILGGGSHALGGGSYWLGGGSWPLGGGSSALGAIVAGLGWNPDVPDRRDYGIDDPRVDHLLNATAKQEAKRRAQEAQHPVPGREKRDGQWYLLSRKQPPKKWDVRWTLRPGIRWVAQDQGPLSSCTANAVGGLIQFLIERGCGEESDVSRLFLYKTARQLLGWSGDIGCYIRTTVRAAGIFGAPPEKYWPYDIQRFDDEPDGFLFAFGHGFRAMLYARLDQPTATETQKMANPKDATSKDLNQLTLAHVKWALADGFPVAFGFPVYSSLDSAEPDIPFPDPSEAMVGGHAVLAVGYDDAHQVAGAPGNGALLIRNSWGRAWGNDGYGYLPYDYIRQGLAADFWTIFKQDWLNERPFDA